MSVSVASIDDIPVMVKLINSAYRGETSKQGWSSEAEIVAGDQRTDEAHLNELMKLPGAVFLKYTNEKSEIEGCVFLQKRLEKLYLGMLTVSPVLQAKGIGRQIMTASDSYASNEGCHALFMKVISIREELIAWYERQGYYKTGEKQPFEDSGFGYAKRPLEFLVLQKDLK